MGQRQKERERDLRILIPHPPTPSKRNQSARVLTFSFSSLAEILHRSNDLNLQKRELKLREVKQTQENVTSGGSRIPAQICAACSRGNSDLVE